MKLVIKTAGASPAYPATEIAMEQKIIANALQYELTGSPAPVARVELVTQEFLNRHSIKAVYHSGTFMSFSIPDEALDEFEMFPKR